MGKGHKTISMDNRIIKDIKKRKNSYGFNFSDWVTSEYIKQFLSIMKKKDEIIESNQKISLLEKEIKDIGERKEAYKAGFSRAEKRFLLDVPRLINEGKEWKPLMRRFGIMFGREMDLKQFKRIVNSMKNENKR